MKLGKTALLALRGLTKEDKKRVAALFGVDLQTLYKQLRENKSNGPLTLAANLFIIEKETGLNQQEILEGLENAKVAS